MKFSKSLIAGVGISLSLASSVPSLGAGTCSSEEYYELNEMNPAAYSIESCVAFEFLGRRIPAMMQLDKRFIPEIPTYVEFGHAFAYPVKDVGLAKLDTLNDLKFVVSKIRAANPLFPPLKLVSNPGHAMLRILYIDPNFLLNVSNLFIHVGYGVNYNEYIPFLNPDGRMSVGIKSVIVAPYSSIGHNYSTTSQYATMHELWHFYNQVFYHVEGSFFTARESETEATSLDLHNLALLAKTLSSARFFEKTPASGTALDRVYSIEQGIDEIWSESVKADRLLESLEPKEKLDLKREEYIEYIRRVPEAADEASDWFRQFI